MFRDSSFVAYEIASNMSMLEEFRDIYGMRFTGLEDPASQLYNDYSYPNPEAPYPRDIVIDGDGIVRYWSTEYDPQKIIETIRNLLNDTTSADEWDRWSSTTIYVEPAVPNPSRGSVQIGWQSPRGGWTAEVFDVTGRTIQSLGSFDEPGRHSVSWDGQDQTGRRVPAGVYFLRLQNGGDTAAQRFMRID